MDTNHIYKSIASNLDMSGVNDNVSDLVNMTRDIPAMLRNNPENFEKAQQALSNPRAPKSVFIDPISVQHALGYKDRRYSLTYETLRRTASQIAIIQAIINTRIAQIASFSQPYRITKSLGFAVRHKDTEHLTTPAEKEFIKYLELFISACGEPGKENPNAFNKRDKFETFIKKIVRDTLTYDQLVAEVIPKNNGTPFEFRAVDASTIRIASSAYEVDNTFSYTARNTIGNIAPYRYSNLYTTPYGNTKKGVGDFTKYVQLVNGQIENTYTDDELIFGIRNPRTDIYADGYGFAEIEQLITIVTSILYAETYNRIQFAQGSQPKGLLNLKGDNWTPEQLEDFRRHWTAQVAGVENCVAGNTKIWTPYGAQNIEDLLGEEQEKEISIWTGTGWCSALAYKTKEPKRLVHTKLWSGLTVSTSPDHKFKVLGEEGPEWRRQEDLEIGDYVLVNKKPIESNEIPSITIDGESKKLSEGMLEVFGWQIGDGYLAFKGKNKRFQLFYHYDKEVEIRDKHFNILKAFGLPAQLKDKYYTAEKIKIMCEKKGFKSSSNVQRSIQLFNSEFSTQLINLGFNPSSKGKTIPPFIYSLPTSYKAAFLRGLFSADGNLAKRRSPCLSITSYSLREEVKLLLISLGIRTSKSEGRTKVAIRGRERKTIKTKSLLRIKDRDRFLELVGFLQDHKQPTEMILERELGKTNHISSSLTIRYARICQKITEGTKLLTRRERSNLSNIVCGKDGCSLNNLLRYMEKSKLEIPEWMINYNFEPVIEIDVTDEIVNMYDVSVYNEEHQFMASGIACHNSWKTPVLQSEGIEWIDLQRSNRDMEFNAWLEYLIKIACGVFLCDPAEINFDLHGGVQQTPLFESSQEWKLKASRDRGLKPLLRFISNLINTNIIDRVDDHFCFEFMGLDELTEQEKHEMAKEQISSYMTMNEVRRSMDLTDIPLGDVPVNPNYIQLLQLELQKKQMEEQKVVQQQQAEEQKALQKEQNKQQSQQEQPVKEEKPKSEPAKKDHSDGFNKSIFDKKEIVVTLDDWKDLQRSNKDGRK